MLEALKFVRGAVAKKDFVPELTHYLIRAGRITGFNGRIALSCKIDTDLDIAPKALPFIKAIERCETTTKMHVTPTGKVSIKSGKKRFLIDQMEEKEYPEIVPEDSEKIELPEQGFTQTLKELLPFVAEDASRPWAKGILFRNGYAYATNNIILVQKWLGFHLPFEINFPQHAINELIRIKRSPTRIQVTENAATFWFDDDTWMRTNLLATEWPDLDGLLDKHASCPPDTAVNLDDNTFQAVEDLSPFVDELGRIFLNGASFGTTQVEDHGAHIEVGDLGTDKACYHFKQLKLVHNIAQTINFAAYPNPCSFFGEGLRGLLVGIRT